jgi:tellurite resistance protein TerC
VGVSLWVWIATVAAILVLIAADFVAISRNPYEVSLREAGTWSAIYIGVALAFGVLVWAVWGSEYGAEYLTGWLVEKSLSVDNLFVFVILMTSFAVPPAYQHRVLLFGVTAALVMRAIFIAVAATATRTPRSTTTPCCAGPGGGCRPPTATTAPG